MINLELYKIFVIVGNELNITKASEKLNISQPAITKHINNIYDDGELEKNSTCSILEHVVMAESRLIIPNIIIRYCCCPK